MQSLNISQNMNIKYTMMKPSFKPAYATVIQISILFSQSWETDEIALHSNSLQDSKNLP